MNTGKKGEVRSYAQSRALSQLRRVQQRFEAWRRARKGRTRIPQTLWRSAVKMAEIHGVNRVATALRLDYYSLKKRVEAKAKAGADASSDGYDATPFVEVTPFAPIGTGECTVEVEDVAGSTMRIHLRGYAAPDLPALTRTFRNSDS